MNSARPMILLALVLALAVCQPAAAHHDPSHAQCAPVEHCLFAGCWYDLLNDSEFSGTYPTCTPWMRKTVTTSSACWSSQAAVITPAAVSMYQDFSVPLATTGTLDLALEFATIGTPTSPGDQLIFGLVDRDLGISLEQIVIPTASSPLYCHRADRTFSKANYAGRNLRFSVRAMYATPGVTYHINWIQLFAYPN